MTWRVDDVDFRVFVEKRGVFGVNGDASLFFNRVGVHRFAFDEHAILSKNSVGEGGLAVVHVGDDGDVSYFHKVGELPNLTDICVAHTVRILRRTGSTSPNPYWFAPNSVELPTGLISVRFGTSKYLRY